MTLFVGIDGGGTKTQACFFEASVDEYHYFDESASRTSAVGWEASQHIIRRLILHGVTELGVKTEEIRAISLCLSGIDLPEQSERMAGNLQPFFPNTLIEVVNDSMAVLTGGTTGKSGIVLIVGTGSVCAAEDDEGHIVRAGGYGSLIGDEGSGYDIGRQGLLAAIRAAEGRGMPTVLWDLAAEFFQVSTANRLIPRIYESVNPLGEIASFAPLLLKAAPQDEAARLIVEDALTSYTGLITSVYKQLDGLVGRQVILSGGLFSNTDVLMTRLKQMMPEFRFRIFGDKPSYGAALRAVRFAKTQCPQRR